jgi:hypothetical protein
MHQAIYVDYNFHSSSGNPDSNYVGGRSSPSKPCSHRSRFGIPDIIENSHLATNFRTCMVLTLPPPGNCCELPSKSQLPGRKHYIKDN